MLPEPFLAGKSSRQLHQVSTSTSGVAHLWIIWNRANRRKSLYFQALAPAISLARKVLVT